MTVIRTRYVGATEGRGSRIVATVRIDGKVKTLSHPFDYVWSDGGQDMVAAALAGKHGLTLNNRVGWFNGVGKSYCADPACSQSH